VRGILLLLSACSFRGAAVIDAQQVGDASAIDAAHDASTIDAPNCSGPCFRRSIAIAAARVGSASLSNYPLFVSLDNDDALRDHARGDGFDIAFTDANGISLDYERETYVGSTGHLLAWVRIPTLTANTDALFYMTYGNAQQTIDQQHRTATWASNYKGVWHLDDSALHDSTANNITATSANGLALGAAMIGNGATFTQPDASATTFPQLTIPASTAFDPVATTGTISLWVKYADPTANHYQTLMTNNVYSDGLSWASDSSGGHYFYPWTGDANDFDLGPSPFTGQWQYLTVTYDFTASTPDAKLYIDGTPMVITVRNIPTLWTRVATLGDWIWGWTPAFTPTPSNFTGQIDEIRIQNSARSAQFIKAESANLHAPSSFYTLGTPEAL
jgi:hypothetical protein